MVNNVTYMKSWLARGAKNTLLDHYKKKNPELLHNEALIESLLVDNYTPETNVTVADELENLLAKLQQRIERSFLAKEYYGYDYREISELLDIPVPTLKSRVFRMRKRLIKEGYANED